MSKRKRCPVTEVPRKRQTSLTEEILREVLEDLLHKDTLSVVMAYAKKLSLPEFHDVLLRDTPDLVRHKWTLRLSPNPGKMSEFYFATRSIVHEKEVKETWGVPVLENISPFHVLVYFLLHEHRVCYGDYPFLFSLIFLNVWKSEFDMQYLFNGLILLEQTIENKLPIYAILMAFSLMSTVACNERHIIPYSPHCQYALLFESILSSKEHWLEKEATWFFDDSLPECGWITADDIIRDAIANALCSLSLVFTSDTEDMRKLIDRFNCPKSFSMKRRKAISMLRNARQLVSK